MLHFLGLKLSMALAFALIQLLHAASQINYDVKSAPMPNADSSKPKEIFSLDIKYQPAASEAICLSTKTRSLTLVFVMIFFCDHHAFCDYIPDLLYGFILLGVVSFVNIKKLAE